MVYLYIDTHIGQKLTPAIKKVKKFLRNINCQIRYTQEIDSKI